MRTIVAALGLFLTVFACLPLPGETTYYVAPDGNDAWSGSAAVPNPARTDGPLATLAGARDALRTARAAGRLKAPVRVIVREGTHALAAPFVLECEDSGTAQCPITYAGEAGKARPVISGGRVITGWKEKSPGLWVASVPEAEDGKWELRQLFVNGQRRTLARTPNTGWYRVVGNAAPVKDPATGKETDAAKRAFRFKPGDIKPWPGLGEINAFVCRYWETGLLPLAAVDEQASVVSFTGPMKWPFFRNQRYFLENSFEFLDAPGEWWLDRKAGLLYYRPMPGEDMARASVIAPALTQLVLLAGKPEDGRFVEHVRFENLSFRYADHALEREGHCDWQAAVTITAVVQATGARFCEIRGCEVAHIGTYAIWFERGCTDNRVEMCEIHDVGAGGVRVGEARIPRDPADLTGRITVFNNFIHDIGRIYAGAIGVWVGQSSDNVIAHNEICDTTYTGISVGWTWGYAPTAAHRNLIEYNHIHHIARGVLSDLGAIYTLGTSPGTKIRFNHIHDVWSYNEEPGAGGIYPDEGSSQILIENNVVYRTTSGGLTVHYGKENTVRNNIFAFGRDCQVHFGRNDKESSITFEKNIVYFDEGELFKRKSTSTADYNLYFQTKGEPFAFLEAPDLKAWQAQGFDVHGVIADPQFEDAKAGDFRLKPGSPALALGFQPIDISQAGLQGSPEWVNLPKKIVRPAETVPPRHVPPPQLVDDGFEESGVGATAEMVVTHGETPQATIRVTAECAAAGKHSLKFTDAAGLDHPYNPHIWYSPHLREGMARQSFDLRHEKGAIAWIEWRDNYTPYRIGPSLGVDAAGKLTASKQEIMSLPAGQWVRFEIVCGLGKQAAGLYDLSVAVPGQPVRRFEKLPCDPKFTRLDWLGFVSNATEKTVFYLDNMKLERVTP